MLLRQGHDVTAVFMKNWDDDDDAGHCPAEADLADAREIADRLGIELQTVSFSAEYWQRVFAHFLEECAAGRTPSPDIVCNREIKFRAFLDHATAMGAEYIATGHYARIRRTPVVQLLRAADESKDQTYFLHTLTQAQLARSMFPLGDMLKQDVRAQAARSGFTVADKKDSTGICFIGERRFREFLARYLDKRPGEIRTLDNTVIGQHEGVSFYTIGQRQGLGIGGRRETSGEPWYVADKDIAANILYVVQGSEHPALYRQGLRASQLHWISGDMPALPYACQARIRHQQPLQAATITAMEGDHCTVLFADPQRAVAAGQSVVFYDREVCLGGGIIEEGLGA
jgi:tRNA-specific 2-thiouridylase